MRGLLIVSLVLMSACKDESAEAPDPVSLTAENLAYYCMMDISEHAGPKAQIFLDGLPDPIFFAQVRDAFTYLASAEQEGYVAAVYVNDMAEAPWETPGADNWIHAKMAHFVVGSEKAGGMGAPELVPFSDLAAAETFVTRHGGAIFAMDAVPEAAFMAPVELVFRQEDQE